MKKENTIAKIVISIAILILTSSRSNAQTPPVAPVREVVYEYHGIKVTDPYRYMEDLKDEKVQAWIKAQADYSAKVLKSIPGRDVLFERLQTLDRGKPFRIFRIRRQLNGDLFYMKLMATDEVAKLYWRDGKTAQEKILIDPGKRESSDEQHYSMDFYNPSADGRYVVYGLSKGGSEESVLHILDVSTGKDLEETIDRIETAYNTPNWLPDGHAFVYCRRQKLPVNSPATERYKKTKAYLHILGSDPEKDKPVFAMDLSPAVKLEDVDFPSVYIPYGSKYAIGKIKHGDTDELTLYAAPVKSIWKSKTPWEKICDVDDAVTLFAVHHDDLYLMTYKDALRYKVIRTSFAKPNISKAEMIIPESEVVIDYIAVAKDGLYTGVIDDGFKRILRMGFDKDSEFKVLELPNRSSGYVISASPRVDGVLVYTNSWTKGSVIYTYNPYSNKFKDSGLQPKGEFDDLPGLESVEVKVEGYDGVMVPLSIIYKSDITLDGNNPTLLNGYGAYGSTYYVSFNPLNIAWLERGGVLAIAHVRGGGEYGKEWHFAGRMLTKPNTWKDFIACAEYLIENKYTSNERLAGRGRSAGGILIGRAITERPDLFAAAIINVGTLDAIRMETTANGVPNIQEFGTVKTKEGFKGLYAMSSYHHVRDGVKYPAVLLTCGMNDPRVDPWHSAKMTARLQTATESGKPILFRVDYGSGHGIGSKKSQYLEKLADEWSFLLWRFDIEDFQMRK